METGIILFFALVGSLILLILLAVRGNLEGVLTMVLRGLLGAIAIYFLNISLRYFGYTWGVGVNFYTVLTSAILGFPGFLALFLLSVYFSL